MDYDSDEAAGERETFEVSEWDRDNEFNPNRSKRRSKGDAIYGIFNEESEEELPVRKPATRPMSFVPCKSSPNLLKARDND